MAQPTQQERPLESFSLIVVFSIILAVVLCLVKLLSRYQRLARLAQQLAVIHNRSYALMSVSLALLLIAPSSTIPGINKTYIYHLSKIYEYIDLILVRLAGQRISWGFAVHHFTTPYWTYLRCIEHTHRGSWTIFAVLNAAHHAMMYANFGGIKVFKPMLKYSQSAQLGIGLGVEIWGSLDAASTDEFIAHVIAGGLLLVYASFFIKEYLAGDYDAVGLARSRKKNE